MAGLLLFFLGKRQTLGQLQFNQKDTPLCLVILAGVTGLQLEMLAMQMR
jgi:hypothetical protein